MGGAHRAEVTVGTSARGRGVWPVIGTIVVAGLLLTPVVWITLLIGRAIGLFGETSEAWLYAVAMVLVLAVAVWLLFRLLRQNRQGR